MVRQQVAPTHSAVHCRGVLLVEVSADPHVTPPTSGPARAVIRRCSTSRRYRTTPLLARKTARCTARVALTALCLSTRACTSVSRSLPASHAPSFIPIFSSPLTPVPALPRTSGATTATVASSHRHHAVLIPLAAHVTPSSLHRISLPAAAAHGFHEHHGIQPVLRASVPARTCMYRIDGSLRSSG